MSAHTPGPWSVGTKSGHNANIVYSHGEDKGVCQVYGIAMNQRISELTERDAEGTANARLIAAAPELLEACQRLVGSLGVMVTDKDSDGDIIFARAAISKATGAE